MELDDCLDPHLVLGRALDQPVAVVVVTLVLAAVDVSDVLEGRGTKVAVASSKSPSTMVVDLLDQLRVFGGKLSVVFSVVTVVDLDNLSSHPAHLNFNKCFICLLSTPSCGLIRTREVVQ